MVAGLPIAPLLGMTLPAKTVGFLEWNLPAVGQVQHITVLAVMTIQAPPTLIGMLECHRVMKINFPRIAINLIILKVALRAGEYSLREWRRGHRNQLLAG